MSMCLGGPFDVEPTHTIITNTDASGHATDESGWIGVENRVVEVAMRYGTAVHLSIDGDSLRHDDRDVMAIVRMFERLHAAEQVLSHNGHPEYRATLPDDAAVVLRCLSVGDGDDAWIARTYGIAAFAVVTDETWLYRSTPHHAHIREVNAAAAEGFLDELRAALDEVDGSGVFSMDPLVVWTAEDKRYELTPEVLHITNTDSGNTRTVSLQRLAVVHPLAQRDEIALRWQSRAAAASSLLGRAFWGIVERSASERPGRIQVPNKKTRKTVISSLKTIDNQLNYGFSIEE